MLETNQATKKTTITTDTHKYQFLGRSGTEGLEKEETNPSRGKCNEMNMVT